MDVKCTPTILAPTVRVDVHGREKVLVNSFILELLELIKILQPISKKDLIEVYKLVKSRFFLHADIRNFFPSIKSAKLNPILRDNKDIFDDLGLELEESLGDIRKICFKKDSLSIGAVSSPVISNVVMYSFDETMLEYCKANGYLYSRYADDIYISSKSYIPKEVLTFLQRELINCGFTMNYSKTKFCSSKSRRKVTGLVITDNSCISIGTERRKAIKKMVYDKLVHGKGDPYQILGHLPFLKDVEPNTYNNLIIKYSGYCSGDVIKELSK